MAKTNFRQILKAKGFDIPGEDPKKPAKGPKYKTSPEEERTVGDIVYDSKLEMKLHQGLLSMLDKRVTIHRQVPFELSPSFRLSMGSAMRKATVYLADFVLDPNWGFNGSTGLPAGCLVLDAKGMVTDVYALKKKLFERRFDTPLTEVKSKDSIHNICTIMSETLNADPNVVQMITGGTFKVTGYQSAGENTVSDLTLKVIGRDGYIGLAKESLSMLPDTVRETAKEWADKGRIGSEISEGDLDAAVSEVKASLEKILTPDGDPWSGGKNEELNQLTPCILFQRGAGDHLVVLRMQKVKVENERPLDTMKRASKKKAKTLFKEALMAKLPAGAYLHRVNLYPGKYEKIEPAP